MKKIKSILLVCAIGFFTSNLVAQEITVFQGSWGPEFYQDKDKLTWKEIDKIMKESVVSEMSWQKSKKQALGGLTFGAVNFGASIWLISNIDKNESLVATDYHSCRFRFACSDFL